jgi:hypothetical protein
MTAILSQLALVTTIVSSTKLRAMWNKIKGDYDFAMTNFTTSVKVVVSLLAQ